MLPASDVFGRNFQASSDDMNSKLKKGDLIVARIGNFDRSRDPLITLGDRELGKIESGELVRISPSKIPRLIGKQGTMIQIIETATNATITIGQNGWVVVSCETPDGLSKAIKAIKMVEKQAHIANLTDRIKSMLESKSE
jgi:exosome complex component RRP4